MTFYLSQSLHKTGRIFAILALACVLYSGLGLQKVAGQVLEKTQLVSNVEQENNGSTKEKSKLENIQDAKILTLLSPLNDGLCLISHQYQHLPIYRNVDVVQVPTPPPEH